MLTFRLNYVSDTDAQKQDGVLIRGPKALPGAKRAFARLNGDNPYQLCVESASRLPEFR